MDTFFDSLFANSLSVWATFTCIGAALATGLVASWICSFRLRSSKSLFVTGALMPAIIATIFILLEYFLKDNVSTTTTRLLTIAVALGLLRFRSVNGKAEEMVFLFISVAIGVAFGIGYVAYGVIIGLALAGAYVGLTFLPIFTHKKFAQERLLQITIPESLDYSEVFDNTFDHYLSERELVGVKTVNLGSLFRLSYRITMKDVREEKEMIDELRTKNGNLEISLLPYVEERKAL